MAPKLNLLQKKALGMWFILALAYVVVQFHRISLAVIMDYITVDFGISEAAVGGALAGMYANIYMVMQLPSGLLADSWGPRLTITRGMLVAAAGTLAFALAPGLPFAFLGRGMIGLGVSVVLVSVMKFQVSWFNSSVYATMVGLTLLIGNLGKAFGTTPLAHLASGLGWRESFLAFGAATLLIAFLSWFLVRDHPSSFQPEKFTRNSPPSNKALLQGIKNVIKNHQVWFLLFGLVGLGGTSLAFSSTWSVYYLMHIYDMSREHAADFLLIFTLGLALGSPLVGHFSDRIQKRKIPLLALFAMNAAVWLTLILWSQGKPPEIVLYIIFFFMGFSLAGVTIVFSLAKDVNDPEHSGTALGLVNMGPFVGMAALQPLQGYVLDVGWDGTIDEMGARIYPEESYLLLFLSCLAIVVIASFFALMIKEPKKI